MHIELDFLLQKLKNFYFKGSFILKYFQFSIMSPGADLGIPRGGGADFHKNFENSVDLFYYF